MHNTSKENNVVTFVGMLLMGLWQLTIIFQMTVPKELQQKLLKQGISQKDDMGMIAKNHIAK
jgi:hypothetical protein